MRAVSDMADGWAAGLAAVPEDARREAFRLGAEAEQALRTWGERLRGVETTPEWRALRDGEWTGCACPGDCEGGPECLDDEGGPLASGPEDPDERRPVVSAPTGDLATDWAFGL